jgi:hypothetical protein
MRRHSPGGIALSVPIVLTVLASPLAAQQRWLPDVTPFSYPLASPRVTGLVGRYVRTTVSDDDFAPSTEGEAALGANVPVLLLRGGPRPISFGVGAEVYGRFNLTDEESALISNDWTVGFNVKGEVDRWRPALEVYHESSHLGDEYHDHFNATRENWSRELTTGWLGFLAGRFTFTGGLTRVLRGQFSEKPWGAALALDYRSGVRTLLGLPVAPVAGIFTDSWEDTDWKVSTSLHIGVALPSSSSRREFGLGLIGHWGRSTQSQFHGARSDYYGAEVRFSL